MEFFDILSSGISFFFNESLPHIFESFLGIFTSSK